MPTNERRLADFVRISGDWFWETDADNRFTYFEQDAARTGFPVNPRVGTTRRDGAVPEPENLKRIDAIDAYIAERKPFRDMLYKANSNGNHVWISITGEPRHDERERFAGYRGVARDVTSLVKAREELERKSRVLDAILTAMPDGVLMFDGERNTLAINDRVFQVLEVERPSEIKPETADEVMLELARRGEFGPGDPAVLARQRLDVVRNDVVAGRDGTYVRQALSGRWVEVRLRSLGNGAGLLLYRDVTEGRKREEEAQRQSALLKTLFDNFPGGIAVYDRTPKLIAWNRRYVDVLGCDPEVVRYGATPREILVSQARNGEFGRRDDFEAAADRRAKALQDGRLNYIERVRPNGRAFEMRRSVLADGGSVSIYLDTTQRNKAERELKELNDTLEKRIEERTRELEETERFQRALIAQVPGMVYRCANDRLWSMSFVSEGSRELLGVSSKALLRGEPTYNSLIHPHEQEAVWAKVQADFAQGDFFEMEYRVRQADGSWRWVWDRAHAIRDEAGKVVAMEGLVLNIDTRRKAVEEAKRATDNLLDAVDSVEHNMILYDRDDRLVLHTRHLHDQYPQGDEYFRPGRSFPEIFRDIVDHGLAQIPAGMTKEQFIAERIAHHRRADGEIAVRHLADGRILHISEHRSQSGGIVAIGMDVTRQVRTDAQLREAQRMDAIGRLTGGLAHDLNNYLAVIMGNIELLAEHGPGDERTRRLVGNAMAGAQRGAELTRSLLAFSRRQPLDPKVLDLGRSVAAMVQLVERTIGERIEVKLDIAAGLWPVKIDGAQLDSAIVNLANNARDAMPDGGTFAIAVRNAGPDDPDRPDGEHVLIEIADSGAGMDETTLRQAFEPFFTTKGPGHGTGLGLSMVHGFVHQSGGVIRMSSVPGKGTTVRLYLPRTHDPAPDAGSDEATAAMPRGREHVLLVEDNLHVRATAVDQLRSLGYTVTHVESGDAALALLEADAKRFDLVFSDVLMPGHVDGYELAKQVLKRWPDRRVLLTSGFSGEVAGGADGGDLGVTVLRKPYRTAELARTVRSVLDS
jgi:PAS domain S-box-containing protein